MRLLKPTPQTLRDQKNLSMLSFNGLDQYATTGVANQNIINAIDYFKDFTISFFIRVIDPASTKTGNTENAWPIIFYQRHDAGSVFRYNGLGISSYKLGAPSGKMRMLLVMGRDRPYEGYGSSEPNVFLNIGALYHIAITYNPVTLFQWYINGVKVPMKAVSKLGSGVIQGSIWDYGQVPAFLGAGLDLHNLYQYYSESYISNLAVFTRMLTHEEISTIGTKRGKLPKTTWKSCAACYPGGEKEGNILYDLVQQYNPSLTPYHAVLQNFDLEQHTGTGQSAWKDFYSKSNVKPFLQSFNGVDQWANAGVNPNIQSLVSFNTNFSVSFTIAEAEISTTAISVFYAFAPSSGSGLDGFWVIYHPSYPGFGFNFYKNLALNGGTSSQQSQFRCLHPWDGKEKLYVTLIRNSSTNIITLTINGRFIGDFSVTVPTGASQITGTLNPNKNAELGFAKRPVTNEYQYWQFALTDVILYNRMLSLSEANDLYKNQGQSLKSLHSSIFAHYVADSQALQMKDIVDQYNDSKPIVEIPLQDFETEYDPLILSNNSSIALANGELECTALAGTSYGIKVANATMPGFKYAISYKATNLSATKTIAVRHYFGGAGSSFYMLAPGQSQTVTVAAGTALNFSNDFTIVSMYTTGADLIAAGDKFSIDDFFLIPEVKTLLPYHALLQNFTADNEGLIEKYSNKPPLLNGLKFTKANATKAQITVAKGAFSNAEKVAYLLNFYYPYDTFGAVSNDHEVLLYNGNPSSDASDPLHHVMIVARITTNDILVQTEHPDTGIKALIFPVPKTKGFHSIVLNVPVYGSSNTEKAELFYNGVKRAEAWQSNSNGTAQIAPVQASKYTLFAIGNNVRSLASRHSDAIFIYAGMTKNYHFTAKEAAEMYNQTFLVQPKLDASRFQVLLHCNRIISNTHIENLGIVGGNAAISGFTANQLDPLHADYALRSLTPLRSEVATVAPDPEVFDYYISDAYGSDLFDGKSEDFAVKTIAKLEELALAHGNGVRIKFVNEDTYYDELDLSTLDDVEIDANFSTIDASELVEEEWTQPDSVTYPNVWAVAWTLDSPIGEGVSITIDNQMPAVVTTLALCNSTPMSYHVPNRTGTTITVYVNAGSNPNTDGKAYRIMKRLRSLWVRDNAVISKLITQTQVTNNGSLETRQNATYRQSLAAFGHKHNSFVGSGLVEDCIAFDSEGLTPSYVPFITYQDAPQALETVFKRCFAIYPTNRGSLGSAFYAHGGASAKFKKVTIEESVAWNINNFGNPLATDVVFRNCYGNPQYVPGSATLTGMTNLVENCLIDLQGSANSTIRGTTTYRNLCLHVATGTVEIFRLQSGIVSLTLEQCTIAGGDRVGMLLQSSNGGAITVQKCCFGYSPNFRETIALDATMTYTGNYNIFYDDSNNEVKLRKNGVLYTTLASWQAATGQDAQSVFVTVAQRANLFLGDPANGDFRINPNAQVTAANGQVFTGTFPDGTPLTAAGAQEHWNWNSRTVQAGAPTRWPVVPLTYEESKAYIKDPTAWVF